MLALGVHSRGGVVPGTAPNGAFARDALLVRLPLRLGLGRRRVRTLIARVNSSVPHGGVGCRRKVVGSIGASIDYERADK